MNLSNIIQEIFQREKLEDVSLEQLQSLTEENPSFALGHFLLLKKMQQTAHSNFENQLHKTTLFFNNPLWLQFLLQPVINEPEPALPTAKHEQVITKTTEKETIQPHTEAIIAPQKEEQLTQADSIHDDSKVIDVHNNATLIMEASEPAKENVPEQDEVMVFEPYHTIDYFASLGIKVGKNVPANDKLGRQLKSFTQWLKTLKPIQEAAASQDEEVPLDENVEAMAAISIKEKETLTESMAEVLVKQGKNASAIEVYNKLSLLNPNKSHYFAAKIDALKQL